MIAFALATPICKTPPPEELLSASASPRPIAEISILAAENRSFPSEIGGRFRFGFHGGFGATDGHNSSSGRDQVGVGGGPENL